MQENEARSGEYLRRMNKIQQSVREKDPFFKTEQNIAFVLYLLRFSLSILAVVTFLLQPVVVSGSSMDPTLKHGERLLVEKMSYYFDMPERGDIVVCHYPGHDAYYVKRVIALPGESIAIDEGNVYIDGKLLVESFYWDDVIFSEMDPYTVPENSVFVMGDNRNHSEDSRVHGAIPMEEMMGRAMIVALPLSAIRLL